MNFKEAIMYVKTNEITLDSETCLLGVAYLPNDSDGEFQVVGVTLNDNDHEEEDVWVDVIVEGGSIGSSSGTEEFYGGEDYDDIVGDIKGHLSGDTTLAMIESLNYHVFNITRPMGLVAEQTLFELFPSLPEPDLSRSSLCGSALINFKAKAIEVIKTLNL